MKKNKSRQYRGRHLSDNPDKWGPVIHAKAGENAESLIRRFKRLCKRSGLQTEIRERYMRRFVSKSEAKREKKNRAIKRRLKSNNN